MLDNELRGTLISLIELGARLTGRPTGDNLPFVDVFPHGEDNNLQDFTDAAVHTVDLVGEKVRAELAEMSGS